MSRGDAQGFLRGQREVSDVLGTEKQKRVAVFPFPLSARNFGS